MSDFLPATGTLQVSSVRVDLQLVPAKNEDRIKYLVLIFKCLTEMPSVAALFATAFQFFLFIIFQRFRGFESRGRARETRAAGALHQPQSSARSQLRFTHGSPLNNKGPSSSFL